MNRQSAHGRRKRADCRSGFALIITLGLMALLVLTLYAMTAMGRVSARIAGTGAYQIQARQNALLGLQVALGTLQATAGADDAITGMAGISGIPAGAGNPARHWCGVWSATGEFKRWLASGATLALIPSLDGTDALPVLASGTLGADGADKEHVRVLTLPVELAATPGLPAQLGRFAWWVGDEGVKLSSVIPESEAPGFGGKHGIDELIPGLSPVAPGLSRVVAYGQLAFVPTPVLTPGLLQSNFHALGRTHQSWSGPIRSSGLLNINSTSARYWRGIAATYNRLQPSLPLGISPTVFGNRMRDNIAASTSNKLANGPFLTVDDFLAGSLLASALQGSGVTVEEFGTALRPWLVTRSDTFRIRAWGAATHPVDPAREEAQAWCEALVQRQPVEIPGFGRRFVITHFRWLGPDDI